MNHFFQLILSCLGLRSLSWRRTDPWIVQLRTSKPLITGRTGSIHFQGQFIFTNKGGGINYNSLIDFLFNVFTSSQRYGSEISLITTHNTVILVRNVIKFKFKNFFNAHRAKIIVLQVILLNVCVLVLFQCLFLDEKSFETKQKSKYKFDFNFIFI